MWAVFLIYLFCAVNADNNSKNSHSPCQIVINEWSHSNKFLEIAKLCPPKQYHENKGLSRFHLLIVDEDNILRFKENLSKKRYELIDMEPLTNEPTPRKKKRPSRRGKKTTTERPNDDCERSFRGCGDDSTFQRRKREIRESQPNVRGLSTLTLDGFNFDTSCSYGFFLLRMSNEDHKKGTTGLKLDTQISIDTAALITKSFHDYLLITPQDSLLDQTTLTNLLPSAVPARFLEVKQDGSEYSFSKCDSDVSTGRANGFIHSKPTKGQRNYCKSFKEEQPYGFKGKTLRPQSKEFIINVITNLNRLIDSEEWRNLNVVQAAGQILNLSPDTLYKVMNEYADKKVFTPPGKRLKLSPVTDIDDEKKDLIYKTVTGYYKSSRIPYFRDIFRDWFKTVRENQLRRIEQQKQNGEEIEELYHCGASSFGKILKKQGYRYGKIQDRDSLIFRPKNIELRKTYLRLKSMYDVDPSWDIVYQDETWIDTHARADKGWRLKSFENFIQRREFSFETAKISRGARLIVMAVGGEKGFVPGTSEVFVVVNPKKNMKKLPTGQDVQIARDTNCEDYHENVTGDRFFRWMENVLKALKTRTVIVMDNCSTHKVRAYPSKSSTKKVILSWLQEQRTLNARIDEDISEKTKLLKGDLLRVVDRIVREKKLAPTKIEQLVQSHGHKILLTPPYQPELQPIESVWADIKRGVREENTLQTVSHAKFLANRALSTYPTENWKNHIRHVLKVQQEFIDGDKAFNFTPEMERDESRALPIGPVELTIIDVYAGTYVNNEDEEDEEFTR